MFNVQNGSTMDFKFIQRKMTNFRGLAGIRIKVFSPHFTLHTVSSPYSLHTHIHTSTQWAKLHLLREKTLRTNASLNPGPGPHFSLYLLTLC